MAMWIRATNQSRHYVIKDNLLPHTQNHPSRRIHDHIAHYVKKIHKKTKKKKYFINDYLIYQLIMMLYKQKQPN